MDSKAALTAKTVSWSPCLPTIWRPTGIPSESNLHGTLAAINPIVFMGQVKGTNPHSGFGYGSLQVLNIKRTLIFVDISKPYLC